MKKESNVQAERPMKDVTPKKGAENPIHRAGSTKTYAQAAAREAAKAGARVLPRERSKAKMPPVKRTRGKRPSTAVAIAQAPREAKNVLAIIADAAANPAVNPSVMRELLDMQKEIMAEQSKRDFNAAFIALQRELPTIRRDGKIEIREKVAGARTGPVQQATPYATFNGIMATIKPLLIKHGFALSFETEPMAERILVKGRLEGHGHERTTAFPLPAETSGSKNNVQGWGSSMSYGKRYCTIALLNIISEDPKDRDTDGNPNKPTLKDAKGGGFVEVPDRPKVTEEQAMKLRDLIEWCGVGTAKFVDHYGIKVVSDLPADLFSAAEKDCKDYHENQQRKARG